MIITIPSSSLPPPPQFPNRENNSPIEKIDKKYKIELYIYIYIYNSVTNYWHDIYMASD